MTAITRPVAPAFAWARIEPAPWNRPEPTQREPDDAPRVPLDHPDPTQEPRP